MPAVTYSANAVAREASADKRIGRTVSPKQVRDIARTTIARFSKATHPAYQSHAYSADERKRIMAVLLARAQGRTVTAPTPRKRAPRKVATVTPSPEA